MTAPVIWLVAAASAILLIGGGFSLAAARFRARVLARRRRTQQLQGQLDRKSADPFGELKVIGEQLQRIQERLGQAEEAAGLPVTEPAGAPSLAPAPHSADLTVPSPTLELEDNLQLFKHEVYEKTKRIDALAAEKQRLAEKIVELESSLSAAQASAPASAPGPAEGPPGRPSYGGMALVDVLQQEADELRGKIEEQDRLIKALEAQDSTGLVHELERIRTELVGRNEELAAFDVKLGRADKKAEHHQARSLALEREKEKLAAKALDAAAQLRTVKDRVHELEQQLAVQGLESGERGAPGQPQPAATTSPYPAPPRAPRVPARPTPPPLPPTPPPSPQRSAPLPLPTTKEPRPRSGIFPTPRSKKDLID